MCPHSHCHGRDPLQAPGVQWLKVDMNLSEDSHCSPRCVTYRRRYNNSSHFLISFCISFIHAAKWEARTVNVGSESETYLKRVYLEYSIQLAEFPFVRNLILLGMLNTQEISTDKFLRVMLIAILHKNQICKLDHIFEVKSVLICVF